MNNKKKIVALLLTLMLVLLCGMPCVSAAEYAPVKVQAYRVDASSTAWLTLLDVGGTAYHGQPGGGISLKIKQMADAVDCRRITCGGA